MSFFKKLFGSGKSSSEARVETRKSVEHKGFNIEAQPYREGGQFQLAGMITKEIDGVRREYKFVRADRFSSADEAADFAISKGRQIIDEQGEALFN